MHVRTENAISNSCEDNAAEIPASFKVWLTKKPDNGTWRIGLNPARFPGSKLRQITTVNGKGAMSQQQEGSNATPRAL